MDNFEAAIIKAASPSNRPPKDQPVAPSLGLILEEHFTPRYVLVLTVRTAGGGYLKPCFAWIARPICVPAHFCCNTLFL